MNEEQAVLEFFSKSENLPLALTVADHIDQLRLQLNNQFWKLLSNHVATHHKTWIIQLTDDRNDENCIVGFHLLPPLEQQLFLQPMIEQQYIQGEWRIFFGLMWSKLPTPDKLNLPEIISLQKSLQGDGYKDNETFLAWRWSALYPRRKDFLLQLNTQQTTSIERAASLMNELLVQHGTALHSANQALANAPVNATISLANLRDKLAH